MFAKKMYSQEHGMKENLEISHIPFLFIFPHNTKKRKNAYDSNSFSFILFLRLGKTFNMITPGENKGIKVV